MEEQSSGGASEGRGVRGWWWLEVGGHSAWTMDEQSERERGTLEVLELFSLFVSLNSHGSAHHVLLPLHLSFLLHPALGRLWNTRSTRPPPPSPSLPLAPSACLPSLLPGRPGQCWRHSRDLQEICLSEKQLVRLSTANVCMLGPGCYRPSCLAVQEPGQSTIGALALCLPYLGLTPLKMTLSSLVLITQSIFNQWLCVYHLPCVSM